MYPFVKDSLVLNVLESILKWFGNYLENGIIASQYCEQKEIH